ncbi:Methyltransferase domain [Seminavis robusta]|uniref:Methyltransferase domain n=1 Tax=Seminavis robusta TaxID=568900 RepID=A0A9N8E3N2_9STRA|nr:Methyltransferase domain [Seminavis robusta]|eukprot:Sro585_g171070.1 Methyltransferase domain (264) ;mRNA; f:50377-51287
MREAQKLLKKHNGNLDSASEEYFGKRQIQDGDHYDRVSAAWDTVAIFLPVDYKKSKGKVEAYVDRRLDLISSCCLPSGADKQDSKPRLLDVGCGDGAIFPKISNLGLDYHGVDISPEMIRLGRQRFPNAKFQVGSFPPSSDDEVAQDCYDTLVFNGSLQFFPDTAGILGQAMACLRQSRGGRIVLSHVEGSKFVQHECRTNPSVAVRNMPTEAQLREWAAARWNAKYAVKVRTKEDLLLDQSIDEQDRANEDFYLMALDVVPN